MNTPASIVITNDVVVDTVVKFDATDLARLKAAGVVALLRYISVDPHGPSDIQPDEVVRIHAAGLGLMCVFEEFTFSSVSDRATGFAHGMAAKNNLAILGYPETVPVTMTVQDVGITRDQYDQVVEYSKGFAAAINWKAGLIAYGGTAMGRYVLDRVPGYIGVWKAGAGSWSGGMDDYDVAIAQHTKFVHPTVEALKLNVTDSTVKTLVKVWGSNKVARLLTCIKGSGPTVYILGPDGFKSPSPPGDIFFTNDYLSNVEYFLDTSGQLNPFKIVSDAVLAGIPDRK